MIHTYFVTGVLVCLPEERPVLVYTYEDVGISPSRGFTFNVLCKCCVVEVRTKCPRPDAAFHRFGRFSN